METERDEAYRILCEKLHAEACARRLAFYMDPRTGYQVTTKIYLESVGKCCECGCRHCPYGFKQTTK
jgi:hypothetical protein